MRRYLLPLLIILFLAPAPAEGGIEDLPGDLVAAGRTFAQDAGYIASSPLRLTSRQAITWGGVLGLTWVAYANDEPLAQEIKLTRESGVTWFHELGEFFEPTGHMGVMNKYYFGGLGLSYLAGQDHATQIFAEILEAHFIAGLGKNLAQTLAGRSRPHEDRGSKSWGNDDATSFPSGHSINIFQLATVLSHHADRTWFSVGAYTIAASVGVQRAASDAHWPSDVVISAAFGTAVARCVVLRHEDRAGPRARITMTPAGPGLALVWNF